MKTAVVVGSFALSLLSFLASGQTPSASKPSFEVATVKAHPNPNEGRSVYLRQPGGRLLATKIRLAALIQQAYRIRSYQIIGGPDWVRTDFWDIEARAEEGTLPTPTGPNDPNVVDGYALRLQSLLEDRFQLKMHRETKDLPVFDLVVAKGGPKLKLSEDQTPPKPPYIGGAPLQTPQPGDKLTRGTVYGWEWRVDGSAATIAQLIRMLPVDRPVMDKTGLTGYYDFTFEGGPQSGPAPSGEEEPSVPPLFIALEEQLGLKLESSKAPGEVLVIDHVERPSEN